MSVLLSSVTLICECEYESVSFLRRAMTSCCQPRPTARCGFELAVHPLNPSRGYGGPTPVWAWKPLPPLNVRSIVYEKPSHSSYVKRSQKTL